MNEITCLMLEQDKVNQSISSSVTEMQNITSQVVTATTQQNESSKVIIQEVHKMNDLTNNVSSSIGQLTNAGTEILTTVRKMNIQANEVNQMIGIQMEAVIQVSQSSNMVKITSQAVGKEGEKLNEIADNLVSNSEQLKTYVNQFKIGADEIAIEKIINTKESQETLTLKDKLNEKLLKMKGQSPKSEIIENKPAAVKLNEGNIKPQTMPEDTEKEKMRQLIAQMEAMLAGPKNSMQPTKDALQQKTAQKTNTLQAAKTVPARAEVATVPQFEPPNRISLKERLQKQIETMKK